MKKASKNYILPISIAILGLVWIFTVIAYVKTLELPQFNWGCIGCTLIAIVVAEIYLLVFRKDFGEQTLEPNTLGVILTICFLLIVVLLNSIFVLLKIDSLNWILFTLNLIVLAGYVILLLWGERSTCKLAKRVNVTEEKIAQPREISRKLGELLAITEDAEIRGKLLKLKEAVDYSTNISTAVTAITESEINGQLDELAQLTMSCTDRLILLKKIEAAEMTWKMRSSMASSVR